MNLLCQYNKQGLGQKKLFVATSHPVVLEQTSFSTASGFLPFHEKKIEKTEEGRSECNVNTAGGVTTCFLFLEYIQRTTSSI